MREREETTYAFGNARAAQRERLAALAEALHDILEDDLPEGSSTPSTIACCWRG